MDLGIAGRVALVAAASRGLGYASARALVAEGASALICARDAERLEAAATELRAHAALGARVEALALDVAAPQSAARLVEYARDQFGRLDILVNNAGGPPPGAFDGVSDEQWEHAFQLTLMSVVRLTRAALPLLRASDQGRIITIASASVKQPIDNLLLSNAIRPGVIGLAKTLSRELGPTGITVNNVLPGTMLTDRVRELRGAEATRRNAPLAQVIEEAGQTIPLKRIGRPDELGALVAFLASAQAGYITGASIQVDGGATLSLY